MSAANITTTVIGTVTINVTERFDGRSMDDRIGGEREYTRNFWADASVVVDPQEIRIADGVPRLGDVYFTSMAGFDSAATCREVSIRQRTESPKEWTIEARYSSAAFPSGGSMASGGSGVANTGNSPGESIITNPLLLPTKVRPGTKKYQRPFVKAVNGDLVKNAAGDLFDPPAMREMANLTLTVTRNLARIDFLKLRDYHNVINDSAFLGFPTNTLKVDSIEAVETFEQGVTFWAVTMVLEVCALEDETWGRKILNAGYQQLVAGAKGPCYVGGVKASTPQLLDAAGAQLAVGGTPVYLEFFDCRAIDFTLLRMF